jgi:hypothetical protein
MMGNWLLMKKFRQKNPRRFFTDIDVTMNSLLYESRKNYLDKLVELDKEYDKICKDSEDSIKQNFAEFQSVKENLVETELVSTQVSFWFKNHVVKSF